MCNGVRKIRIDQQRDSHLTTTHIRDRQAIGMELLLRGGETERREKPCFGDKDKGRQRKGLSNSVNCHAIKTISIPDGYSDITRLTHY